MQDTTILFEKLFNGDFCVRFNIYNEKIKEKIYCIFHSFSKFVKNYNKKAIDVIVLDKHFASISIYPIDADDFISKFRKIAKKYKK